MICGRQAQSQSLTEVADLPAVGNTQHRLQALLRRELGGWGCARFSVLLLTLILSKATSSSGERGSVRERASQLLMLQAGHSLGTGLLWRVGRRSTCKCSAGASEDLSSCSACSPACTPSVRPATRAGWSAPHCAPRAAARSSGSVKTTSSTTWWRPTFSSTQASGAAASSRRPGYVPRACPPAELCPLNSRQESQ